MGRETKMHQGMLNGVMTINTNTSPTIDYIDFGPRACSRHQEINPATFVPRESKIMKFLRSL